MMTQKKKYRQIEYRRFLYCTVIQPKISFTVNDKPDKDATDLMTKPELLAPAGGSEPLTCLLRTSNLSAQNL